MSHPLADEYLRWLEPQVISERVPARQSYWGLLGLMYGTEFKELVPYDDNRIVDGLDLRTEFCYAQHISSDALRNLGACSFLEVLVGLSRRLAFADGGQPTVWAWILLDNLELRGMTDPLSNRKATKTLDILDSVVYRRYAPNGAGGFFPLMYAEEDQRQVELWYQMSAYISESHPEHT